MKSTKESKKAQNLLKGKAGQSTFKKIAPFLGVASFLIIGTAIALWGLIYTGWNWLKFIENPQFYFISLCLFYFGMNLLAISLRKRKKEKYGFTE